jgi:hypothetical protein
MQRLCGAQRGMARVEAIESLVQISRSYAHLPVQDCLETMACTFVALGTNGDPLGTCIPIQPLHPSPLSEWNMTPTRLRCTGYNA